MTRSLFVSTLLLSLAACGDSTGTGAEGGGGQPATGGNGSGGAPAADCAAGKLCLEIDQAGDPAPGRLAVVWLRFEGTVGHDPTIGFEDAFDPSSARVEIALDAISAPPDKDLLCERGCADPLTCPCTGEFQAGVAYVLVVTDVDASGAIEPEEIAETMNYVGIANAAVVFSPATDASVDAPFNATFPSGVKEGTLAYRITAEGNYEPGEPGEVFQLRAGTEAF